MDVKSMQIGNKPSNKGDGGLVVNISVQQTKGMGSSPGLL